MIDDLNNKYNDFKNVIDVLPLSTKYNRKRKMDYILEALKEDDKRLELVDKEIHNRINYLNSLNSNEKVSELTKELEKCNIVNEWNIYNTPYEKMHLDYYLYQLNRYYKEDLTSVNKCIKKSGRLLFVACFWTTFFAIIVNPILFNKSIDSFGSFINHYWFLYTLAFLYWANYMLYNRPVMRSIVLLLLLFFPFISNLFWTIYLAYNIDSELPSWGHDGFLTLYSILYYYLGVKLYKMTISPTIILLFILLVLLIENTKLSLYSSSVPIELILLDFIIGSSSSFSSSSFLFSIQNEINVPINNIIIKK